jgi:multiple sugar transport system substrate-binding protein
VIAGVAAGVALTLLVDRVIVPGIWPGGIERGGELVILSGEDDSTSKERDKLISKWNSLGGGRPTARIQVVGGDTNLQRSEMVQRAQGNGSPVDIYNLDVILMAEFREFGYIKPLDESRVTDIEGFLPNPMRTCRTADGTLWALPFNTDAALLYSRSDLGLPEAFPNSLQALDKAIVDLLTKQPDAVSAGYAGQLAGYEGLTVNAIEAIWAAGGSVVDSDGNVKVDSQPARDGLAWLANGLAPGGASKKILYDSLSYREKDTAKAFIDGKVAYMRNWPVWHNEIIGPAEEKRKHVPFKVSPLPGRSVLGGQNLAVAATTKKPRAAQALIDFLTGDLSQQILFERGGFAATRRIVYEDEAVRAKYDYTDELLAAINGADLRPQTAYYTQFSQVFREGVLVAIGNGGQPPADFADKLSKALKGKTT